MSPPERPVAHVPRWILLFLAVSLAAQICWKAGMKPGRPQADELPRPPSPQLLHIAAFGEPATLARLVMLYLQAFDYHGTNALPFRKLDYQHLTGWLASIQDLDKLSEYPLFVAARVYSDVPDKGRQRMMLEFVYRQFLLDPNRRWQWLAHAALVAKHQLKDLQLARKYAHAVDQLTTATNVPLWAKQMEIFILEDMNEFQAARIMLGGLLESGLITDPVERRFLENRLREMEQRQGVQER